MTNNPTIEGVSRVLLEPDREMRVYIAGPMTGIKDYNFPAFNAMADKMRAAGWHVENPADHGLVPGAEWGDYLRYDIGCLASCEAIMLLPGWTASRGARLEVSIAKELGVAFMYADGAEHAPAIERQEPCCVVEHGPFDDDGAPQWVRVVTLGDYDLENIPDGTLLWMAPSNLEALQSTIAQLQARVEFLKEGIRKHWKVACDQRARIAELESGK